MGSGSFPTLFSQNCYFRLNLLAKGVGSPAPLHSRALECPHVQGLPCIPELWSEALRSPGLWGPLAEGQPNLAVPKGRELLSSPPHLWMRKLRPREMDRRATEQRLRRLQADRRAWLSGSHVSRPQISRQKLPAGLLCDLDTLPFFTPCQGPMASSFPRGVRVVRGTSYCI